MQRTSSQTGFTLLELIITISIAAIMLAMATPSLQEIYHKNSLLSYSSDLRVALYRAQNEAIKRNRIVTVQAKTTSNDYWQGGWDIYLDTDNDSVIDPTEEVISTYIPSNANQTLKTTSFGNTVTFDASGIPETKGAFWVCRPDNNSTLSKTVNIEFSGFISVVKGATCP